MQSTFHNERRRYEEPWTSRRFIPGVPLLIRIDGRCFHTFCRGLERPYDINLSSLMTDTCKALVETHNALIGYTQSDEITLIFFYTNWEKMPWDGKEFKILGDCLQTASNYFNFALIENKIPERVPSDWKQFVKFDCRGYQCSVYEMVNQLYDREADATRNSLSMAAQAYYSHNELYKKTGPEKQEMLFHKGINWNNYPVFFKRGVYFQRKEIVRSFTPEEIEKLPSQHAARKNPNLTYTRHDIIQLEIPPIRQIVNPIEVILDGAIPKIAS